MTLIYYQHVSNTYSHLSIQRRDPQRQRNGSNGRLCAMKQQMLVYVPPHPLVKHWLAIARNAATPPSMFRGAIAELGRVLFYEASKEFLQTVDATVMTPTAESEVSFIDPTQSIKVVPIIRAGLVLCEHAASILPAMETYHVGIERDPRTLEPSMYYNKLPAKFSSDGQIVLVDVIVGTGGTTMLALDEIVQRGGEPGKICIICGVTAPPALKKISEKYPEIKMYAGIIDPEVSKEGYIVPGIGDAGDRCYGTN